MFEYMALAELTAMYRMLSRRVFSYLYQVHPQ